MAGEDMAEKQICQRMQKMIQPYLDDELSGRDSAQFIAHIRECEECRHELETSFIVDYAVRYLDEGKMDSFDIKGMLDARIEEGEKRLARRQTLSVLLWIGIVVMAVIIVGILISFLLPELFSRLTDLFRGSIENISGGAVHE